MPTAQIRNGERERAEAQRRLVRLARKSAVEIEAALAMRRSSM
jgi:hypothetical protein